MSNFQGIRAALRLSTAAALSLLVAFSASAQTVRYIHTDGLGSVVLITDKDRNSVERSEYEPYGNLLNHPVEDGPGYTGHIMDAATKLTYMQQRYYDPDIGRFPSVDPVGPNPNTGVNFNRYKYASNNPFRFTDPDGRYDCTASGGGPCSVKQSEQVDHFVTGISKAMKNLNPKSDGYKKLDAVSNYLGKVGDNNGVTITPSSLAKNTLASAGPNGNIQVDLKQIANFSSAFLAANPGKSAGDIGNARGSAALAHEGRHELDYQRIGYPNSRATEYRTEMNAYQTQAAVGQGLGMNLGLSTPQEIAAGAAASTDTWCQGNPACK
ncbi:RHS repeat-associated core domain-containing protein [Xanthomonas sp. 3498]|uniref:RHS repeat domain-containing protein n=1 Tax=Xanthomonas sp. 3498 TaxID=2663863 RepID=UPI00161F3D1A|nr:RHS repeat-associated core domain-containing protein [Xanthomonas sp. 3498]MBB5877737.1 RHS repeat-associated protein [Xanthomonas sp. 3498]